MDSWNKLHCAKQIDMVKTKPLNRKDFIVQSASLLAAATRHGFMINPFAKYKMGLQLFTVRGPLAKDLTGSIKKIAAIGYEDCETYGYDPEQKKYYGIEASAFKQLLADNKMITTSGHYDFTKYFDKPTDAMMKYVDQCVEGATALGQKYITWPWLDPVFRTIENFIYWQQS
jgi:hypothetical protein